MACYILILLRKDSKMKKKILFVSLILLFISSIVSKGVVPGLAQTSSTPIINIYNNIPTGSSGSVFSAFKFLVVAAGVWEGGAHYFGVPEWGFFKKLFKPAFDWLKTQTRDQALRFADFVAKRKSGFIASMLINKIIKPFIHWFFDSPSVTQEIINLRNKEESIEPQEKNPQILKNNISEIIIPENNHENVNKLETLEDCVKLTLEKTLTGKDPVIVVKEPTKDSDIHNQGKNLNLSINDLKSVTNIREKMHDPETFPVLPDTNKSLSGIQKTGVSVFELPEKTFTDAFKEFQKKENVEKDVISSEMKKAWERINSVNYSEEYLKNTEDFTRFPKFCKLSFKIKKWLINYFRETANTFLLKDRIGIDVKKFHKYMFNSHICFETRPEFFLNRYQLQNKIARL